MTARTPRRRRRESPLRIWIAAALTSAAVAGFVVLAVTIHDGLPFLGYQTLYVSVPQTGNLLTGDPVRIAGVRVGQVTQIGVTAGGRARLALQLDPGTRLPTGTAVRLRANGLLGSRYVQLIPGRGPGRLAPGAVVRGGADTLTYGVPEALGVFDRRTRGAAGALIDGLGEGLLGRGSALNQTIHLISVASIPGQRLVATLAADGLARLVPALDRVARPLDASRAQIVAALPAATQALRPFVQERAAVRSALVAAPGALASARFGLGRGEGLVSAAGALAEAARAVLPLAPAGLRQTTALLRQSPAPLRAARGLLGAAQPAIPAALRITGALGSLLGPLAGALGSATPILTRTAPYACNVENTAVVLRSMTGFGGTGAGPGGPAMAFRMEMLSAPPTEILGAKDFTGFVHRVGYAAPCSYLASTYPTATAPLAGLRGAG